MFTLLSEQRKKEMMKEYRVRLATVSVFLVSAVLITGAILILPSFVMLKVETKRVDDQNTSLSAQIKDKNNKGLVATLDAIKSMVSLAKIEDTSLFDAINLSVNDKPKGISITSIGYIHGVGAPSSLSIGGDALTRDALLLFFHNLQKEKLFTSSNLPVSNLAKDTDIKYSLGVDGNF